MERTMNATPPTIDLFSYDDGPRVPYDAPVPFPPHVAADYARYGLDGLDRLALQRAVRWGGLTEAEFNDLCLGDLRYRTNCALTPDQVRAIRAAYAAGGVTQQQLADRYGVWDTTISALLIGNTHKRIADEVA